MGIVNSKFIYSTTGTAALAAAVLYYYFIRPMSERRANSNRTLVLGLKNFGYTCYLNSILQALASCDQFVDWIRIRNDISATTIIECGSNQRKNGMISDLSNNKSNRVTLNRAAFPIVAILHKSFILINRVLRGDDDVNSSEVPGEMMKVFNQVLDEKYKSERRTPVNKFRLIDTEEQDTHEVFNHLMSNLSDEFGNEVKRSYDKSVKNVISHHDLNLNSSSVESGLGVSNCISVERISMTSSEEKDVGATGDAESRHSQIFTQYPRNRKDSNRNLIKTKVEYHQDLPPHMDVSISNSFQGTFGSQLQCISCLSRRAVQIESFSSVSLNLPQQSNGVVSLYELLDAYTKPIIVHSVDCDLCTRKIGKKTKSSFYGKSAFAKLPPTLCIHILRTEWNRDGSSYKRKEHVRFPIRLNLTDTLRVNDIMCPENKKRRSERKQQRRIGQQGEYLEEVSRYKNSQYTLRAIVSHRGDVDSGHFVTYRRSPKNENGESVWLLVSDMVVVPVTLEEVLQAKAYMLFYEKLQIPESS